jgi:predicted glycoside hydrolase/deacetylase ChbG (UPF0249 family)
MYQRQTTIARSEVEYRNSAGPRSGSLIINADDWGRDRNTTDQIHSCISQGAVSSVSAMVFMEDSERAAEIARDSGMDAGLHLNFTTPFSAPGCPSGIAVRQSEITRYLLRHRLSQVIYNPLLAQSFQYVVAAQIEEFCRLFGTAPERLDGHHHMHLCANVLLGGLLPPGTRVRRNFSFEPGEKSVWNRKYRQAADYLLARRHRLTDFFFSLEPVEPRDRLQRIFELSREHVVELETHPVSREEYLFLTGGEIFHWVVRGAKSKFQTEMR